MDQSFVQVCTIPFSVEVALPLGLAEFGKGRVLANNLPTNPKMTSHIASAVKVEQLVHGKEVLSDRAREQIGAQLRVTFAVERLNGSQQNPLPIDMERALLAVETALKSTI